MPWLPSLTPGCLCEGNTGSFFDTLSILTVHALATLRYVLLYSLWSEEVALTLQKEKAR